MASVIIAVCVMMVMKSVPPTFALNDHCSLHQLTVVTTKELCPVLTTFNNGSDYHSQKSYVQPLEGFTGVSVNIEWRDKSASISVYFPWHKQCFNNINRQLWWKVLLGCEYKKESGAIWCAMKNGKCQWRCEKNYTSLLDKPWARLHWVAHGPSRWRSTPPPEDCPWEDWLEWKPTPYEDRTCRDPPVSPLPSTTTTATRPFTTITASTTTNTTTIRPLNVVVVVVSVLGILMVVVAVLLFLLIRIKRQNRTTLSTIAFADLSTQHTQDTQPRQPPQSLQLPRTPQLLQPHQPHQLPQSRQPLQPPQSLQPSKTTRPFQPRQPPGTASLPTHSPMTTDDPEENVYDVPGFDTPPLPSPPELSQDISDQTYLTPIPSRPKLSQDDPDCFLKPLYSTPRLLQKDTKELEYGIPDFQAPPLPSAPELPQDNYEEHIYEDPSEMP